jgi:hypothetical protein
MTPVVGVDGCPGGWIAVRWAETVSHHLCRSFADVLAMDAAVIAVDMPIGFPQGSGRAAEREVRQRLGERQSSVFSVPSRAAVMCADYREACAANLASSDPPKKVSKQIFHIFPKMREIDALITPELQARIVEVHPELAFWAMNGERSLPLPSACARPRASQGAPRGGRISSRQPAVPHLSPCRCGCRRSSRCLRLRVECEARSWRPFCLLPRRSAAGCKGLAHGDHGVRKRRHIQGSAENDRPDRHPPQRPAGQARRRGNHPCRLPGG